MSIFNVFDIASSAMSAQSLRLNTVASNLANADSAVGPNNQPYHAKQVIFAAMPVEGSPVSGVRVAQVVEDQSPPKRLFDPKNPLADSQGYVKMPNVNPVEEMVNMISASRSYQADADVMNTAKTLMMKALTLGQ